MALPVLAILSFVYAFIAFCFGIFIFFRPFFERYENLSNVVQYLMGVVLLIGCIYSVISGLVTLMKKNTTETKTVTIQPVIPSTTQPTIVPAISNPVASPSTPTK